MDGFCPRGYAIRWLAAAVVSLVFAVAVAGCAGSSTEDPAGTPMAVAVRIDDSVTAQVKAIEDAYGKVTAGVVQQVVARGGSLDVTVFRGSASGLRVGTLKLDPSQSRVRREQDAEGQVVDLDGTLAEALGLTHADPSMQAHLEALPEGSAIGDALGAAIEEVHGQPGQRWAVVVSDGFANTDGKELPLGNVDRAARILIDEIGPVDAEGVNVALIGIGLSRAKVGAHTGDALTAAWKKACDAIHAARCEVSEEASLPPSLEGGSR
jgi:hypothetical protein